jgi:hypothetical protein
MAAVEAYIGTIGGISGDYPDYEQQAWELANALSASAHFNIIDSYSTVVGRYKGDPVADAIWGSVSQVGDVNDWFVIECQTENPALGALGYSGLPKWQMKFQWDGRFTGNFIDVSDPTGVKYPKFHGEDRCFLGRFAPWGGWDLADTTPDFNPATPPLPSGAVPSSDNHSIYLGGGDAPNRTQYIVKADGQLIIAATKAEGGNGFIRVGCIAGDVIPRETAVMPNPRAFYGNGIGNDNMSFSGFLAEDGNWSNNGGDYDTVNSTDGGWAVWDWNNELVQSMYKTQRKSALMYAQANGNDPATPYRVNVSHPIIVFLEKRKGFIFEIGHCRKMFGVALQATGNKQHLMLDYKWTAAIPWDGTTDPYAGY